jgi:hypothetical protein
VPRILATRAFDRWRKKADVTDGILRAAVGEMQRGLIDADLGGGLVKKRIPLPGRGKRGGARTLLATNLAGRWIFLTGYAKNEQSDLSPGDVDLFRKAAKDLLAATDAWLSRAVAAGDLKEYDHAEEDPQA